MFRFLGATALFAVLAVVMTWPQGAYMATHAIEHQDVYFNMWRLGWVAHALGSPARVFDGNIFYPEARVLTFSDALLVEALVAAPLHWAGLPPVLVYNLVLLGGIVLSGAGAFVLARHLTGSTGAAVVAGVAFSFAPYRFEHYAHLELQWPIWVPWAFWALDRTIETGRWRFGVMTGVFIALQFMSSIYYGAFLAALIAITAVLLLLTLKREALKRATAALALGAALGAALCVPYAIPYLETREKMGGRTAGEIGTYSARPFDYLVPMTESLLYGESAPRRGRAERRLFPGLTVVLLALTAVMVSRPSVKVLVFVLALVAAFEMSLGVRGYSYPFLYEHVPIFESLRAPARLGIFVVFFLGILAAFGYAAVERLVRPRIRTVMAVGVCAVLVLEYWVAPLRLIAYDNEPPPLYAWLAAQPRGVVAEFPMPTPNTLPGIDPYFGYMSTFHWMPTVNGYSGYYPKSYIDRLTRVSGFPDDRATHELRRAGVRYVIVHTRAYGGPEVVPVLDALRKNPMYSSAGTFDGGWGDAVVFRLR